MHSQHQQLQHYQQQQHANANHMKIRARRRSQPEQQQSNQQQQSTAPSWHSSKPAAWLVLLLLSASSLPLVQSYAIPSLCVSSPLRLKDIRVRKSSTAEVPQQDAQLNLQHQHFAAAPSWFSSSVAGAATAPTSSSSKVPPPPPPPQGPSQQQRRRTASSAATEAWARKYTTVDALRANFGGNKHGVWGDLDAASARKLYKTLLPKALLELHQYYSHQLAQYSNNSSSQSRFASAAVAANLQTVATDLAPLAYQARLAAKLYARERCRLPARLAANLYDGFRSWRKYGKFQIQGMSYEQVWDKYSEAIGTTPADNSSDQEEVIAAKIGLKILERACVSNPLVDQFVLRNNNQNNNDAAAAELTATKKSSGLSPEDLKRITAQLEEDVRLLLWPVVLEDNHCVETCASCPSLMSCARTLSARATRQEEPLHPAIIELAPQVPTAAAASSTVLPTAAARKATTATTEQQQARYRRLRQLARMKQGLDRLSSPFVPAAAHATAATAEPEEEPTIRLCQLTKHQQQQYITMPSREQQPRLWEQRTSRLPMRSSE